MRTFTKIFAALGFMLVSISLQAQVQYPVPCKASFTVALDSLTSYPYLYHFTDNSNGDINSWEWDFGDGATSNEQHPSHQYQSEGHYEVCLTVKNLSNLDSCWDQACHNIMTEEYLSLGGLAYAGEYPLNNPSPQGDTGVVSLYRINDNQVAFVEENLFSDLGYYWFGFVLPGKYIVKIGLTPGSKHYGEYFTTYSGDKVNWNQAGIISLENASNYDAAVNLVPVKKPDAGTGMIKGYVNFEQGTEYSFPPVATTTVILSDKNKVPLIYTYPDASGYFHFNDLPFDTYFISADATGKPSTIVSVTLTESAPIAEGINLTIFGGNIFGIPEDITHGVTVARIYPNPVTDLVFLEAFSNNDVPVELKITDMTGKVYFSRADVLKPGLNVMEIPCSSLSAGFYLLSLNPQGNSFPVTMKFIK